MGAEPQGLPRNPAPLRPCALEVRRGRMREGIPSFPQRDMAQPRAYVRQANFTDHTTEKPSDPQIGSKLDSEFDTLNLTLNDLRANLALLQRDDTKVANNSIHTEALSTAVLALIKA